MFVPSQRGVLLAFLITASLAFLRLTALACDGSIILYDSFQNLLPAWYGNL